MRILADTSVHPRVAARHGPVVVVFPPSDRAFDLHRFMRHNEHFPDYFDEPHHHSLETLLAGYIHEKPLGLEVRGNAFPETYSMALEAAFYRVDFAGLSFIAVVVPRADVGCVHLASNRFGAPAFYSCNSDSQSTTIRHDDDDDDDDDDALPASAVYFSASPANATAACRAAATLLSALNRASSASVPPLSALPSRSAAVLERMLASVDRLYAHEHGHAHCDPVEPNVDTRRWERKLRVVRDAAQADCQVIVPDELRSLEATDLRVHGGDVDVPLRMVGNVGDTFTLRLARPVGIFCEMRCTWAATYAAFPGQDSSCYEVARRLHVGLDHDSRRRTVAQAIWPEERILTRRDCAPETTTTPLRVAPQRADLTLEFPFVLAATRLAGATEAEQARVRAEMATLRAKYVHVVEVDVQAPRPMRVQCGDVAVAVVWDAQPAHDTADADFVVVVVHDGASQSSASGAVVIDARLVLRGGLVLITPTRRGLPSDARTLLAVAVFGAFAALAMWATGVATKPAALREKEQ